MLRVEADLVRYLWSIRTKRPLHAIGECANVLLIRFFIIKATAGDRCNFDFKHVVVPLIRCLELSKETVCIS